MDWSDLISQHGPFILGQGIGALVLAAALAFLAKMARGEAERDHQGDGFVLRYAKGWRVFFGLGVFTTLSFLAATYEFHPPSAWDPATSDLVPLAIFGGGALLSLAGWIQVARTEVEVSAHGVAVSSPWTGKRRLAWYQVDQITYAPNLNWFTLTGTDGTRLRVAHLLRGIPTFGAYVREHLGESVYENAARFFDESPFHI